MPGNLSTVLVFLSLFVYGCILFMLCIWFNRIMRAGLILHRLAMRTLRLSGVLIGYCIIVIISLRSFVFGSARFPCWLHYYTLMVLPPVYMMAWILRAVRYMVEGYTQTFSHASTSNPSQETLRIANACSARVAYKASQCIGGRGGSMAILVGFWIIMSCIWGIYYTSDFRSTYDPREGCHISELFKPLTVIMITCLLVVAVTILASLRVCNFQDFYIKTELVVFLVVTFVGTIIGGYCQLPSVYPRVDSEIPAFIPLLAICTILIPSLCALILPIVYYYRWTKMSIVSDASANGNSATTYHQSDTMSQYAASKLKRNPRVQQLVQWKTTVQLSELTQKAHDEERAKLREETPLVTSPYDNTTSEIGSSSAHAYDIKPSVVFVKGRVGKLSSASHESRQGSSDEQQSQSSPAPVPSSQVHTTDKSIRRQLPQRGPTVQKPEEVRNLRIEHITNGHIILDSETGAEYCTPASFIEEFIVANQLLPEINLWRILDKLMDDSRGLPNCVGSPDGEQWRNRVRSELPPVNEWPITLATELMHVRMLTSNAGVYFNNHVFDQLRFEIYCRLQKDLQLWELRNNIRRHVPSSRVVPLVLSDDDDGGSSDANMLLSTT